MKPYYFFCSNLLFDNWTDVATSMLPIYRELIGAGLKVWVFR
jgi:hydroxymandelonitrile lyase/serine carboxypeptidase-like clade 2